MTGALSINDRLQPVGRSLTAAALVCIFAAATLAKTLPVRIFTAADGLGSSFINDLMRDSRGFLWFATRDGLSRFDGIRFVTYQVEKRTQPRELNIFLKRARAFTGS